SRAGAGGAHRAQSAGPAPPRLAGLRHSLASGAEDTEHGWAPPAPARALGNDHDGNPLMLARRIIPCLDVQGGRVVKGVRFLDLADAGDRVEVAARYDAAGADELCFLDITASHEERPIILDVVARTAERAFMPLTVGGGIRTVEDVRALLQAGADKASINTAAVADPEFVRRASDRFGSQCVVVAVDARRRAAPRPSRAWEAYTHDGRPPTPL